jgi:hypothetical protein
MPGGHRTEKPLDLQSTRDLWLGIIAIPAFGGLLLVVPLIGMPPIGRLLLAVPLIVKPAGGWGALGVAILFGACFAISGILLSGPRLAELRRRGAWVPSGTARFPALVAVALALLSMAAGLAVQFAGLGIARVSGLGS